MANMERHLRERLTRRNVQRAAAEVARQLIEGRKADAKCPNCGEDELVADLDTNFVATCWACGWTEA